MIATFLTNHVIFSRFLSRDLREISSENRDAGINKSTRSNHAAIEQFSVIFRRAFILEYQRIHELLRFAFLSLQFFSSQCFTTHVSLFLLLTITNRIRAFHSSASIW